LSGRTDTLKMRGGAGSAALLPPDAGRRRIREGDKEVAGVKQVGQRRGGRASVRSVVLWAAVLVALVVVGKIHACACTGGAARWHRVYPTSEP